MAIVVSVVFVSLLSHVNPVRTPQEGRSAILGHEIEPTLAESEKGSGTIRLSGREASQSRGRLEVWGGDSWGTVCNDWFGREDARVACRQLGFWRGEKLESNSFGDGTGTIGMDDVNCSGTEAEIQSCRYNGWGRHNCGHHEDVAVSCGLQRVPGDGGVRLADSRTDSSGRLEIVAGGVWGTVCDKGFTDTEASVACRQLHYTAGRRINASSGGAHPILLSEVKCVGPENNLLECHHESPSFCLTAEDVGVECW